MAKVHLARLHPFLADQNADGISLLFSTPDFLSVGQKKDIQKVRRIVGTLSLLFTFTISKMDKVELRTHRAPHLADVCGALPSERRLAPAAEDGLELSKAPASLKPARRPRGGALAALPVGAYKKNGVICALRSSLLTKAAFR